MGQLFKPGYIRLRNAVLYSSPKGLRSEVFGTTGGHVSICTYSSVQSKHTSYWELFARMAWGSGVGSTSLRVEMKTAGLRAHTHTHAGTAPSGEPGS